jgi:predicted Zn-dependent protease
MLGIALRGESKTEPAFKAFRIALKDCPQSLAALEGAAESAYALNSPDAKSFINRVIQLRPTDETSYAMLGAIDVRAGDCAGAVESYAKAPSHVNQSPPALQQYGSCLMILGRPAEAVPVLSQLLALQNQTANRIALARAQIAAKEQSAALATLQPLLDAGSQNSDALLLAAQLAEDGNETPKAVQWLRKAIELDPKNINAYLAFSEICFNHGSFKIGIDFLNLGIQQLPSEARLYLARGVLEEQMTQVDAALGDFEKAHQLNPQLSFAEDAMGMLLSQKHDPAAALGLFAKQSQLHPEDPLLQYLYAEALSQTANADEKVMEKAISTARRAVRLEPTYQPARDLLCVLLLRHNDLAEVIAEAQEATRRDPYDEAAIYQELLAEHKLKHSQRIASLVKQLQDAKAHNEKAKTKYVLEEAQSSPSPH